MCKAHNADVRIFLVGRQAVNLMVILSSGPPGAWVVLTIFFSLFLVIPVAACICTFHVGRAIRSRYKPPWVAIMNSILWLTAGLLCARAGKSLNAPFSYLMFAGSIVCITCACVSVFVWARGHGHASTLEVAQPLDRSGRDDAE